MGTKESYFGQKTYNDEHLYTLTRSEFAKEIGKSREAVKMDMRRGKYKQLYIFKNGQYYFKGREAVRENKGSIPLVCTQQREKLIVAITTTQLKKEDTQTLVSKITTL